MYLLNLTLGQFLALFGSIAATLVVLYLLDRSRRKQVVATLRFWIAADQPPVVRRRKRIQQPFSLILQLISMLLLLLAIAQLRLGAPLANPRDHVMILDTSAWMAAFGPAAFGPAASSARQARRTLMDEAREKARAYLKSLPSSDRVMLVRADALTTPATAFEYKREKVLEAIAQSTAGSTALNLDQALAFAHQAQALGSHRRGEIVYIGAGRVTAQPTAFPNVPTDNLRVLPIADPVENCGLRKIGVRRSRTDPDIWEIYVSVHNYGTALKTLTVNLTAGGAPAGARRLLAHPGKDQELTFEYRTRAAALLEAKLLPHDAFPDDDQAVLELPPQASLAVTVYSDDPDLLRPIVGAVPRVKATFHPTSQYRSAAGDGLVILDRFRPPSPPLSDAIWIEPPAQGAPIPVKAKLEGVRFEGWCSNSPLCAGLRSKDLRLPSALVFDVAPDDIKIGQAQGGPVIVARGGTTKTVVFGFHPAVSDLRYELATPLLFANILRWMAPELFRHSTAAAGSVGTLTAELDPDMRPENVRVLHEDGSPLPFTTRGHTLRFFTGTPGTVRVLAEDRETVYSLTLPEMWDSKWEIPASAKRGIPAFRERVAVSRDLWQILAVLGGIGLLTEWILFGRLSRGARKVRAGFSVLWPRFRKAS
jgi:hypothetical protein